LGGDQLDLHRRIDVASGVMDATTHQVPTSTGLAAGSPNSSMTSIGPSSADHGSPGSRRLFRPDAELAATQFGRATGGRLAGPIPA